MTEEIPGCDEPRMHWDRVLWINLGATAVAILLYLYFRRTFNVVDLAMTVVFCFIYANSIGTLCAVVLTYLGPERQQSHFAWYWGARIAQLLGATAAGTFIANVLLLVIRLVPAKDFWESVYEGTRFSAIIALSFGIGMAFYTSLRERLEQTKLELRERQLAEERARKLAAEAQLSSLESRVHPHFLFNTLNSIAALIPEDPRRAEDMVQKLAALLRFSLDANQQRLVPLRQELKVVSDYLEIEMARFGSRLRYSLEVPAALEELEVPPLAVQTLVENSIKFAIAPRREGGRIMIAARRENGSVDLEVSDDGPGFSEDAIRAGHGLENLRLRLAALFGAAARLQVTTEGGRTRVRLSIPQAVGLAPGMK